MKGRYLYGMPFRGISPGAQPNGIVEFYPPSMQYPQYWNVIVYDKPLTDKEISDYELVFIRKEDGTCKP